MSNIKHSYELKKDKDGKAYWHEHAGHDVLSEKSLILLPNVFPVGTIIKVIEPEIKG